MIITCDAIGSSDPKFGPPSFAVEAGKTMIAEYVNLSKHDVQQHGKQFPPPTRIDAQLLEAWRAAVAYQDHYIYKWLRDGAPRAS